MVRQKAVVTKVEPKAKPVVSKTGDDSAFWKTLFTACSIIFMLAVTFALIFNSIGVSDKKIDTFVKGSRDDPSMVDYYGEMDLRTRLGCKNTWPGVIGDIGYDGKPKVDPDIGCSQIPNYKKVLRSVAAAK